MMPEELGSLPGLGRHAAIQVVELANVAVHVVRAPSVRPLDQCGHVAGRRLDGACRLGSAGDEAEHRPDGRPVLQQLVGADRRVGHERRDELAVLVHAVERGSRVEARRVDARVVRCLGIHVDPQPVGGRPVLHVGRPDQRRLPPRPRGRRWQLGQRDAVRRLFAQGPQDGARRPLRGLERRRGAVQQAEDVVAPLQRVRPRRVGRAERDRVEGLAARWSPTIRLGVHLVGHRGVGAQRARDHSQRGVDRLEPAADRGLVRLEGVSGGAAPLGPRRHGCRRPGCG